MALSALVLAVSVLILEVSILDGVVVVDSTLTWVVSVVDVDSVALLHAIIAVATARKVNNFFIVDYF